MVVDSHPDRAAKAMPLHPYKGRNRSSPSHHAIHSSQVKGLIFAFQPISDTKMIAKQLTPSISKSVFIVDLFFDFFKYGQYLLTAYPGQSWNCSCTSWFDAVVSFWPEFPYSLLIPIKPSNHEVNTNKMAFIVWLWHIFNLHLVCVFQSNRSEEVLFKGSSFAIELVENDSWNKAFPISWDVFFLHPFIGLFAKNEKEFLVQVRGKFSANLHAKVPDPLLGWQLGYYLRLFDISKFVQFSCLFSTSSQLIKLPAIFLVLLAIEFHLGFRGTTDIRLHDTFPHHEQPRFPGCVCRFVTHFYSFLALLYSRTFDCTREWRLNGLGA